MFNPQNSDQSAFIKMMGMQSLGNTGGNLLSALLYLLTQMQKKPGQPGQSSGGPANSGWFDPSSNAPSNPLQPGPDMWS